MLEINEAGSVNFPNIMIAGIYVFGSRVIHIVLCMVQRRLRVCEDGSWNIRQPSRGCAIWATSLLCTCYLKYQGSDQWSNMWVLSAGVLTS